MAISEQRAQIIAKIEEYERQGLFDVDVEDDPETTPLNYKKVDFTGKKLSTRIGTKIANKVGERHFEGMLARGEVVLKEIRGLENAQHLHNCGALVTCNHFNPFDNYAVNKALMPILDGRDLYKIIREGNYTSFKGLYGYLFRHCNTLPLSSSLGGIKALMSAISTLIERGEKILIYPEQAMWYNYRKPRPLKVGAFHFAVKNNAPVLPIFITLEDTEQLDGDDLPILAYTVHILPPIYPDTTLKARQAAEKMCLANYNAWVDCYESFYKTKLQHTTTGKVDPCSI